MQKPFYTQPELFTTSADLEHSSLQGLDGAKAVLDWTELERLMAVIYASKTGRPSYPLLTLLRASLSCALLPVCFVYRSILAARPDYITCARGLIARDCRPAIKGTAP